MRVIKLSRLDLNHQLGGIVKNLNRIGTSKKDDIYRELQRRGVPGPGMYDSKTGLGGPQYKFGSQKRNFYKTSEVPGPGQYRIPCSFSDVPRYLTVGGGFNETYRKI
jgi:hypothetical protein